jgi:hypothetical protein
LRRGPPDRATCGCAVQVEDGTTDLGRHKAGASLAPRSRRVPAARSGFSQPWGQAPPVRAGLVCGCRFSQGVPLPAVISHRMPVCGYTVERRPSPSRRKATPAAMSPADPSRPRQARPPEPVRGRRQRLMPILRLVFVVAPSVSGRGLIRTGTGSGRADAGFWPGATRARFGEFS